MKQIQFTGAEGQTLAADTMGVDDALPVILAHGGGQTRLSWRRTQERLAAAGLRAIAIDLRGHGESQWSSSGHYRIEDFADDLLCVAHALGTPPALVGASLGGLSGLIAEGEIRPGSFASLTLVDIAPNMEPAGVARVMGFMAAHLETGFASAEEAAEIVDSYRPREGRRTTAERIAPYVRKGQDGRWRWHWDPRFITSVMSSRGEARMERLAEAARRLACPVHLIRGGSSDLVSPEGAAAFLDLVPHARFTDIAGAGHMVVGDRNDAFADAILTFLQDTDQSIRGFA
ncbi:alpha/beta hydrolase [Accumulibacter sp.]|uniref:alpha/beta fold hydrolase n=1 Tax=Accumulibacter sp. TaxID=2053492 RepID=UPI002C1167B8|nr:alpha/beta hydrolase [Accumulibacter sp.]HPU80639.1 alpha/beta hydrolase [Accumulibacter sp.]